MCISPPRDLERRCPLAGNGRRITPDEKALYVKLRQEGWDRAATCRQIGVSYKWAIAFDRAISDNAGAWRINGMEKAVGIGPVKGPESLSEEAKRALTDFDFFRRFYLGHISTPWQVETGERLVELLATPDKEYVAENGPPGVGKTTLLHDFALWVTVRDRSIRGLIGSRKALNAERMLRRIRRSLERPLPLKAPTEEIALGLSVDAGASLAQHYGRFKPDGVGDIWRGNEFIVEQLGDTPIEEKEPTWSSYGVDSGVLGNRFDLILWDDLVDRTNTRTPEVQQAMTELWDNELETRLEPGGLLVLIGQRLAAGDLYAYCRSKQVDAEEDEDELGGNTSTGLMYHRIVYPAHDEERCQGVHRRGLAKPWPEGCLLDPHRLNWKDLSGIRHRNKTTYEVVYQQRDTDPEGVLVNPLWVKGGTGADGISYPGCWDYERGMDDLPVGAGAHPLSVITVDPSPTKYWAVQWWLTQSSGGELASTLRYLMDCHRAKMSAPDFMYAEPTASGGYHYTGMLEGWRARAASLGVRLTHVIIEENAAQRFFTQQPYFVRWCADHRISFLPHQTHRNKNSPDYGVMTLGELWKFGLIRLPGKPGGDVGRTMALKLVDEVQKYPGGSTDDCVMAHWFHEIALPRIRVPDPSKIPRLSRPTWLVPPKPELPSFLAGVQ